MQARVDVEGFKCHKERIKSYGAVMSARDSAEWGKGGPVGGMRHEAVVMRL